MDRLIAGYAGKLVRAGLCAPDEAVLCARDDAFFFSRPEGPDTALVSGVAEGLGAGAAILVRPARPCREAAAFFARAALRESGPDHAAIFPRDCETRTFLHDLPVIPGPGWPPRPDRTAVSDAVSALSRRKGAVFADGTLLAPGGLALEQAFVTASSMIFACMVKFFSDYLAHVRENTLPAGMEAAMARVLDGLDDPPPPLAALSLARGPFADAAPARAAMAQAGRLTVRCGLVDSAFGNVSCLLGDVLHISRTGAALDELEGQIDACPLDNSSCAALTASSEFVAHARIVTETTARVVLHGHPLYSVILSMDCGETDCPDRGRCHVACRAARFLWDAPIVPGEVGGGPRGLARTLPPALVGRRAAMVYGHGLFAVDQTDFNAAFAAMLEIERRSRDEVLARVGEA
ncbi:class II aldolase/adducin family protein [Desulfolutivibrio sulfoxidireducens]|uniref:class II aldolase/adducin family protein n=1 Tax=Desulfolutivibrio sulfoxidireducens TaxID=2773299 RepID=UPI00159E1B0B|nr:class II aldolase/adducin family protein [Desulfolutivibrio sulfoxidireducens]QLA21045.1 rRNA adenine dimethylase [Desulfolutivibrio sulfoxidireducens]